MGSGLREFVADELWLLIGVVTFALAGLAAIAGFGALVPAIAIVGWFLLAPIFLFWGEEIAAATFGEAELEGGEDPLDELKRRYANGEIDDAEFERRVDRLLEADDAFERAFSGAQRRAGTAPGRDDGGPAARGEGLTDASTENGTDEREEEFER